MRQRHRGSGRYWAGRRRGRMLAGGLRGAHANAVANGRDVPAAVPVSAALSMRSSPGPTGPCTPAPVRGARSRGRGSSRPALPARRRPHTDQRSAAVRVIVTVGRATRSGTAARDRWRGAAEPDGRCGVDPSRPPGQQCDADPRLARLGPLAPVRYPAADSDGLGRRRGGPQPRRTACRTGLFRVSEFTETEVLATASGRRRPARARTTPARPYSGALRSACSSAREYHRSGLPHDQNETPRASTRSRVDPRPGPDRNTLPAIVASQAGLRTQLPGSCEPESPSLRGGELRATRSLRA